nr:retrovirus-related Pol polyprotein from transposon TNT 1-94 [Tanacetum cinerariifolium]
MRSEKAKEKGVVFSNVEEFARPTTILPTIDPKDKGKEFDDVQARMDADALLAAKLQEKEREQFSINEQARFLVEIIAEIKRFFAAQRAEQIRNKPPTKAQLGNKMISYLKNMGSFSYNQLKNKSLEEIHKLYEREQKIDAQEVLDEFYEGAHSLLRVAASTPIETNKALLKDEEAEDVDVHLYKSMIRSLMYLTASRPDIIFVVCACDSPFELEDFSDSDYAGASLDRKSITGVGSPFFWQWEHPPLAVGTYTASRNSLLAVGMPCAFYSKQVGHPEQFSTKLREHQQQATPRTTLMIKAIGTVVALGTCLETYPIFLITSLMMEDMCHLVKEAARLLGKQHKASCKSKLVHSVSKPLHTLHMDLFRPTSVKIIRCDNGGEFGNKEMNDFCSRKGIKREFSNARTSQRNGVAERRNRTLIEAARTMLADAKLPVTFWAEAVNTHCYVQNRVLRTKRVEEKLHVDFLENMLIEKGAGQNWLFDIDTLTNSMNYVPVVVAGTFSTNFLGTKDAASQDVKKDVSSLRYIALPNWFHEAHLESSTSNAQDACNVDAPESSGNFNPTATSTNPSADHIETLTVETPIPTVSLPVPTACLDDSPQPSSNSRLISKRVTSQDDTPSLDNILTFSNRFEDILGVTTNTGDANGVEANLGNMENNILASLIPTFRIHMDHLKRVRPIGTRWVLKNKKDKRGIVIRNKAKLVAQGYTQEEGIDYEEVFAPVAKIEAIRLFLAYASFMGFTVYQMDVKSAFLYGTIDEEVYVMQPPGFQDLEFPARVYKKKDGIFLSQDKYVGDILKKFGYSDVRSANTPMDKENPWGKDGTGKDVDLHLYRSMIVSLMYLTASRPNIMFTVCACDRHQVTPKECHLHAVKRIFRYLKDDNVVDLLIKPFDTRRFQYLVIVDFVKASLIRYALTINPTVYVSYIRQFWSTARIETMNEGTKILATVNGMLRTIIKSSIRRNLKLNNEEGISTLPDADLFENLALMGVKVQVLQLSPITHPILRQYSRRARIAQSSALPTVTDEPASPFGDDSQGEALPTVSSLEAGQDMENIIKTSALPYDSTPMVTSLADDEGSMQHKLQELTDMCTRLQRQQTEMASKIATQELEITSLKARIKLLEDKDRRGAAPSGEDATIKGRSLETEEKPVVPPAVEVATVSVPTGSGLVPTASPIFTTASVVTPYSRRKGKEKMVESDTPKKKKLQDQIDIQVTREMEEQLAREDQRRDEQIARDAEIAKIHTEEELQMLIDSLDRNNETIAKSLCKSTQVHVSAKKATLQEATKRILYKQIEDFVPMASKDEGERVKRKGLGLEQESAKKIKSSEEVSEEDLKEMMQLVPVEEVYVEALQHFDREDLIQLWTLVKETLSIRQATCDKENELWVELKRLYEPDVEDWL